MSSQMYAGYSASGAYPQYPQYAGTAYQQAYAYPQGWYGSPVAASTSKSSKTKEPSKEEQIEQIKAQKEEQGKKIGKLKEQHLLQFQKQQAQHIEKASKLQQDHRQQYLELKYKQDVELLALTQKLSQIEQEESLLAAAGSVDFPRETV